MVNLRFRDGAIYQSRRRPTGDGPRPASRGVPVLQLADRRGRLSRASRRPARRSSWTPAARSCPTTAGPTRPVASSTPQPQFCTAADVGADPGLRRVGAPLINPNTGNNLSRTETGPVLLEGFQDFLGQTNVIECGKKVYARAARTAASPGSSSTRTTRAEDDPRYAAAEPWEPGIPRVQVNLYRDCQSTERRLDRRPQPCRLARRSTSRRRRQLPVRLVRRRRHGTEDVKRNGSTACQATLSCAFDQGDALRGRRHRLVGRQAADRLSGRRLLRLHDASQPTDCYDGLRNFNQVRPAVFDGGYAFGTRRRASQTLPAGTYIVEAVAPPGYVTARGKRTRTSTSATPTRRSAHAPAGAVRRRRRTCCRSTSPCSPTSRSEPGNDPYDPARRAPLCDRKQVVLAAGQNAGGRTSSCFTEVPVAGHIVGIILDDLANEFDPNAPNFGEKYAPPCLPISIRDWTGREIYRVYTDEYGTYNALVPSTFSINPPIPSGVSPNMMTVVHEPPGPIRTPDPARRPRPDDRPTRTSTGSTASSATRSSTCRGRRRTSTRRSSRSPPSPDRSSSRSTASCPNGTPGHLPGRTAPGIGGPVDSRRRQRHQRTITITSAGSVSVPNPTYDTDPTMGAIDTTRPIVRDYGFGPDTIVGGVRQGKVIGLDDSGPDVALTITQLDPGRHHRHGARNATSPASSTSIRGDNQSTTVTGITLTVRRDGTHPGRPQPDLQDDPGGHRRRRPEQPHPRRAGHLRRARHHVEAGAPAGVRRGFDEHQRRQDPGREAHGLAQQDA